MKQQLLNGQNNIEIQVISGDGATVNLDLLPDEVTVLERLDRALKSNQEFQASYPNAKLTRVDSNRGIKETESGRYYLRYQYDAGITEFWGHYADTAYVDCNQGLVGIPKLSNEDSLHQN